MTSLLFFGIFAFLSFGAFASLMGLDSPKVKPPRGGKRVQDLAWSPMHIGKR